jgi:hypothetical protein
MIDSNFLEFWGNYLIAVARGQKQLEDLPRWIRQGFQGLEDLTVTFKKCYGLEQLQPNSPAFTEAWKKATADFRKSFKESFGLFGWIPQEEHQKLAEENQRLQQNIAQQQTIIRRMRTLLDEKGLDQNKTLEVFQDLIKKQSDEFQKLMKNLAEPAKPDD